MIEAFNIEVTAANAVELADELNSAFKHGELGLVNGRRVVSVWGKAPAVAWQNGTVSVTVQGRGQGKVGTVYVKVGQKLRATTAG